MEALDQDARMWMEGGEQLELADSAAPEALQLPQHQLAELLGEGCLRLIALNFVPSEVAEESSLEPEEDSSDTDPVAESEEEEEEADTEAASLGYQKSRRGGGGKKCCIGCGERTPKPICGKCEEKHFIAV